MLKIIHVESGEYLEQVRLLFAEYGDSTGIHSSYPNYDEELSDLPHPYVLPEGSLLIALYKGQAAGCVALRKLGDGACEMKRLYVKPDFRSLKIGRVLAETIVEEGRKLGYTLMRLDTLASMVSAQNLYTSLGFRKISPYFEKKEESVFMELSL